MLPTVGFLALTLLTPSSADLVHPSIGTLPPLSTPVIAGPGNLALHSSFLDQAARVEQRVIEGDRLAQRRHHNASASPAPATAEPSPAPAATAPAPTPPESPAPSEAPAASEAPASEAPAADDSSSSTPPEEEEPSIDLIRQREHMVRIHRPLGIATWGSLLVTEALGTVMAINDHTLFGKGACANLDAMGNPGCVFGDWGLPGGGLNALHEVGAFITLSFYTATGIFALGMPDPEHAAVGNDSRANRLRIHRTLAWVHLIGMVVQPILGVIAARPDFIGIAPAARDDFSADLRTIHLGVGYVTFAALTAAMIDELLQ